ncbi:hypothetical protein GOP47_0020223 [Adiantum capillus-veneris]|uniref:Uncharacterized protein n=1 Tax=Adiantum capillus-veneris TaxID=13818 RepID=A0A9D4Z7U0_ADICA|nr:hypothetical protein GOP47_0020223 [Adiantum capillus-veneris]
MHDLEKSFELRMDECFAILDAHGKFELDTTASHDDDLLLPMGNTLADTVAIAQAEVAAAEQAKVSEEEFVAVQAMCLAKRARVDSPPPAATPILLDPKGKASVDLYFHLDADEEDRRQEDVLEVDAWAQRSGGKRTPFGPQAALAHYLGTLPTGVVVFVHADYSPNGRYNIFALRSLSKALCLTTLAQTANLVVLVKKDFAISTFGVNFRGRLIAHVGMNQAVEVNDTQEITTTLLNREPPQKSKRQKIVIRKILKQKSDIM